MARTSPIRWKLPLEWTEMLMQAQVSTSPAVIPVLQALRLWNDNLRPRLIDCDAKIRMAIDDDEPGPALDRALNKLSAVGVDWRKRLNEASLLLRHLAADDDARQLQNWVQDYSMQIESTLNDIRSLDRDFELRSSGVKHYLLETGELTRQGHILHDNVLRRLASKLEAEGKLIGGPSEWSHDPITGLGNCLGFFRTFHALAPKGSQNEVIRLCALKLDRFDLVNQRVGAKAADQMLAAFGALLLDLSMDSAESLAPVRLFGSAIVMFLENADQNRAEITAERMRQAFEASSFRLNSDIVHGTVSCAILEIHAGETANGTLHRLRKLIEILDASGGNRTATDSQGELKLIEPRAFQVQARMVQPA